MTNDPWWMMDNTAHWIERCYDNVERGTYTEEELWFVVEFNRDWGLANTRCLSP